MKRQVIYYKNILNKLVTQVFDLTTLTSLIKFEFWGLSYITHSQKNHKTLSKK